VVHRLDGFDDLELPDVQRRASQLHSEQSPHRIPVVRSRYQSAQSRSPRMHSRKCLTSSALQN
jgi:hypothetical protein